MKASDFVKQKAVNDTSLADSSAEQQKIAAESRAAARAEEIKDAEKKQKKVAEKTKAEEDSSEIQKKRTRKQNNVLLERITLRVPSEEKEDWENFFNNLDYSVSLGIRKAVRYYIKQYNSGRIEI